MKNLRTIFIYVLTLLLSAVAEQSAWAQTAQDALYIFRNDGQFNAFFFGDIDHFDYSKTDTLGIEHEDYVVQEVYALDSVYRIPLSAIDSIAFVTPEPQFKADVVRPDASIANYIVASDTLWWIRLAPNTPKELIPVKGQKLFIEEGSRYIPEGFGGRVTSVIQDSNGYTVNTEGLELKDVFDVVVLKTAGIVPDDGTAPARKGDSAKDADWSYTPPEPLSLPALSASISLLSGSHTMTKDGNPIQVSLDGSLDYTFSLQSDVSPRCFLYLNLLQNQDRYIQQLSFHNTVDASLNLTGAITAHIDLPFTVLKDAFKQGVKYAIKEYGKKLATKMGPFQADFSFGLFFEAQGSLNTTYTHQSKYTINTNTVLDYHPWYGTYDDPWCKWNTVVDKDTTTFTVGAGKASFSTGVYAKVATIVDYPFIKKMDKVEARVDAGLKLDLEAPIFADEAYSPLFDTFDLYKQLNFDQTVTLSTPINLGASVSILGSNAWTPKLSGALSKSKTWGVVPDIYDLYWHDEEYEPYKFTFQSHLKRDLILPIDVGFAVFDKNEKLVDEYWDRASYWWYSRAWKDGIKHVFETLDPKKDSATVYTIRPQIRYMGHPMLVDQVAEIPISPANFKFSLSGDSLLVDENRNHQEMEFVPNMKNVDIKSNAPWLTYIRMEDEGQLTAYWEALPEKEDYRRGVIYLTGLTKDNVELVKDSVVVRQARSAIELSPTKLEFDKKGGTKTVNIVKNNLTDLKLTTSDTYIHSTLNGNTITVTVDPNTSYDRSGWVYLTGIDPLGQKQYALVAVEQEGSGDEPGPEETESLGVKSVGMSVTVNTRGESTGNDDIYGTLRNRYSDLSTQDYVFGGFGIAEEDIAEGKSSVTATIVNKDTIHVECQNMSKQTYYQDANSPMYDGPGGKKYPGWIVTQRLSFDIVKGKVEWNGNIKFVDGKLVFDKTTPSTAECTIANVSLTENSTFYENSDKEGRTRSGNISFAGSEKIILNCGYEEMTEGPLGPSIKFLAIAKDGKFERIQNTYYYQDNLNVTSYSFQYDSWFTGKDEKFYTFHISETYNSSDNERLYFNITFEDEDKFTEWIEME